ncbi:LCP family protein [Saccharomonospora amisosensis]
MDYPPRYPPRGGRPARSWQEREGGYPPAGRPGRPGQDRVPSGRPPANRRPPAPPPARRPPARPARTPAAPAAKRRPRRVAKIALALVSALVMTLTGYAWAAMQGLVNGLTMADVIGEDGGGELPADGSRDILLVGMDSRTDAQGNPLPQEMLAKLRAGVSDGELNTDTLILVHVPNDGSKAVAISFPRDSYVSIPGHGRHKINSAYARGKLAARKQLQDEGVSEERDLEVRANQEGAKTLIKTVENISGVTVDNYASINLLGFYDITKAIGGVEVCLNEPVDDPYSGAKFDAGRQTISGVQALAFVRQRHGLLRGDLDRVVRQQVFMAGLAHKVLSAGTLADPSKLGALSEAIKKSMVVNEGWDILSFAQQMKGLTGGQIEFRTVPVENPEYQTSTDGMAIKLDPDEVKQFIQGLSGKKRPSGDSGSTPAPSPADITVDVYNASGIDGLAGTVSGSLVEQGYLQGEVANAAPRDTSVIQVANGERSAGESVADALGGDIEVEESADAQTGHVQVLLAPDYSAGGGSTTGGAAMGSAAGALRQPSTEPTDPPIKADDVTCVN